MPNSNYNKDISGGYKNLVITNVDLKKYTVTDTEIGIDSGLLHRHEFDNLL